MQTTYGFNEATVAEIVANEKAWNITLATPSIYEQSRFIEARNEINAELGAQCIAELEGLPHELLHDASAYHAAREEIEERYSAEAEAQLSALKQKLGKRIIRNCGGAEVTAEDEKAVNDAVLYRGHPLRWEAQARA